MSEEKENIDILEKYMKDFEKDIRYLNGYNKTSFKFHHKKICEFLVNISYEMLEKDIIISKLIEENNTLKNSIKLKTKEYFDFIVSECNNQSKIIDNILCMKK